MAERWSPLSIIDLNNLFKESKRPFWISGGWAIDLFLGKTTRPHEDLDVTVRRADQSHFQKLLAGWDLRASDPPGSGALRIWEEDEQLKNPVYNIWCRKEIDSAWNLELMLCDFENDKWTYRRNKNIRGPISEFEWINSNGLRIIAPEVQLLYKSRNPREKDTNDFLNCVAVFDQKKKARMSALLIADTGVQHPWLSHL